MGHLGTQIAELEQAWRDLFPFETTREDRSTSEADEGGNGELADLSRREPALLQCLTARPFRRFHRAAPPIFLVYPLTSTTLDVELMAGTMLVPPRHCESTRTATCETPVPFDTLDANRWIDHESPASTSTELVLVALRADVVDDERAVAIHDHGLLRFRMELRLRRQSAGDLDLTGDAPRLRSGCCWKSPSMASREKPTRRRAVCDFIGFPSLGGRQHHRLAGLSPPPSLAATRAVFPAAHRRLNPFGMLHFLSAWPAEGA